MEKALHMRVIGQEEAIGAVQDDPPHAGSGPKRPSVVVFAGPTGVSTELPRR
jgi:ATP-dependent Clp protease ATP-binding subunit ClpA